MRMRILAVLVMFGCSSSGASRPTVAAPAPATTPSMSETAPAGTTTSSPVPQDAEPEAPNPVAVRINARYEAADALGWEKRFERQGREVHDHRAAVLQTLSIEPGSVVADVGVGSGLYTLALAEAVGTEGAVFGVDVQDYFLDHVAEKARSAGLDNIVFVKATQRSVNLAPESLDLIFMCDVFHHVEYPRTYLSSMYAALKPGGRMALIDFIAEPGKSKPWVLEHVRASPGEFRGEFEAAGFVLESEPKLLHDNFFHIYRKPANP